MKKLEENGSGTIYGIGVGPGDPMLLTMRAVQVLQHVASVLVPKARSDQDSLALSIARTHLPASCQILEAVFPMTENRAVLKQAWDDAAQIMLTQAHAGRDIAFLTLGDAMLYSTWSYLLQAIRRQYPDAHTVTIPGITAMSACAAATGMPLAEGRVPLLVWPDTPPADFPRLFAITPNLVFMKAARHLGELADKVETMAISAVAVRCCSLPNEQVTTDLRAWTEEKNYFTTVLMHAEEQP